MQIYSEEHFEAISSNLQKELLNIASHLEEVHHAKLGHHMWSTIILSLLSFSVSYSQTKAYKYTAYVWALLCQPSICIKQGHISCCPIKAESRWSDLRGQIHMDRQAVLSCLPDCQLGQVVNTGSWHVLPVPGFEGVACSLKQVALHHHSIWGVHIKLDLGVVVREILWENVSNICRTLATLIVLTHFTLIN